MGYKERENRARRANFEPLREALKEATPGNWKVCPMGVYIFAPSGMVADFHRHILVDKKPTFSDRVVPDGAIARMRGVGAKLPIAANARYIAEACPDTIRHLLSELDDAKAKVRRVESEGQEFPEFQAIVRWIRYKKQNRSGVPYIDHIREGLIVLDIIGASEAASRAFCLHPFVQADEDLTANWAKMSEFDGRIVALAMEYRRVANSYLSYHEVEERAVEDIELGPLIDVFHMLVADKVQNYKDFLRFQDRYPNAELLDRYFKKWLERLGISDESFDELREAIAEGEEK